MIKLIESFRLNNFLDLSKTTTQIKQFFAFVNLCLLATVIVPTFNLSVKKLGVFLFDSKFIYKFVHSGMLFNVHFENFMPRFKRIIASF